MPENKLTFEEIINTISFEDIERSFDAPDQSGLMTRENQQYDIARIGRLIAKGHVGYNLWDETIRQKFENSIEKFYNGNLKTISVKDFCLKLDKVLQKLPDEHLKISPSKGNLLPRELNHVAVGNNICRDKKWEISEINGGNTAVIALPELGNTLPNEWLQFSKELDRKLFNSDGSEKYDSLVIDIRDNPGGASIPFELLAKKLYGNEVAPFEKSVYRDTREADYIRMINGEISKDAYQQRIQVHQYSDELVSICDYSSHKEKHPAFAKGGYKRPIAILTNRNTASAGESLCQFLKHHPGVTYIGENTAGCYAEISGESVSGKFGYGVKIGSTHAFFEKGEVFERKGFPVDINTSGQDAFAYVKENLQQINHVANEKLSSSKSEQKYIPFSQLANNDFAFIRAINQGMDITTVKNLYAQLYPDKADNFEIVKAYALNGGFNTIKYLEKASMDKIKKRGVSLEVDSETGELIAVADENATDHKFSNQRDDFILHSENNKKPVEKFDFNTGEAVYVDKNLQKIKELRQRLKNENIDYLAAKQGAISNSLEEIGLSKEGMGKTGDSSTGEITEKDKRVAKSQIEDAKYTMLQRRKLQSRE